MPAILPVLFAVATRKNKAPHTEPRHVGEKAPQIRASKGVLVIMLLLIGVFALASAATVVINLLR